MTGDSANRGGRRRLWLAVSIAGLGLLLAWLRSEDDDGPTRSDPRDLRRSEPAGTDWEPTGREPWESGEPTGAELEAPDGPTEAESEEPDGPAETAAAELPDETAETAVGESATDGSRATFELFEDERGDHRFRLTHDNGRRLVRSARGFSESASARESIDRLRDLLPDADRQRYDPAGFEVFEDEGGKWRWRLRHRNGRLLADGGEGYADRRGAREALASVREQVADAPPADEIDEDDSPPATVEVYEDGGGSWRWRLVHRNGNLVAESSRGYASESGARDGLERVRQYAPEADVVAVGDAVAEMYEDEGGRWRWRLRHRNGTVLATSTRGYGDRSGAVDGLDSARRNVPEAPTETVDETAEDPDGGGTAAEPGEGTAE